MASIVAGERVGPKPGRLPPVALVFRRRLLAWYARHRRRLPWRGARDPYAVLVRGRGFAPRGRKKSARRGGGVGALAGALVPRGRAADWNQALMDLGATYCTARRPRCQDCPVWGSCATGRTRADREKE